MQVLPDAVGTKLESQSDIQCTPPCLDQEAMQPAASSTHDTGLSKTRSKIRVPLQKPFIKG